ncbi:MAG: undecaprenyl-phosphate glucose phosphotransferase [Gemmataceae bacterium]|nr:undecaprenyl-phosphate glucose phosphotransferase [Gemmata sp.]MDW8198966.1 undecaprenyl-phosphate glucose phosphotransferase [Gemmataceae bacterium]
MVRRVNQTLVAWFLLGDLACTSAAWLASYFLRFHTGWLAAPRGVPAWELYLRSWPLVLLLGMIAFRLAGMYEVHRLRRFREEVLAVGKGVALMILFVVATSFARHAHYESRAAMVLFGASSLVGIVTARRISWTAVRTLRSRGLNPSRAVIVGTGRLARRTERTLQALNWSGIQPIGYVEDAPYCTAATTLPVLGSIAELPQLVARYQIEHVFVALPLNRYADARRVFGALSQTWVDVRLIADIPTLAGLTFTTTQIHGLTVIGLRENPHYGLNIIIKRLMDVVLSLMAIVLLAPLMAVIAVLVKVTSPGPILYRQERCGLNGKPFWMLKFRTMKVDAEAHGPQMTARNDNRRTRLGVFLRATNLDELPQLFNVLWGDMSLVGPRPERPVFVHKFAKSIPNYNARHAVKAGITGWAQVNGWRGNSSLRKRIQFDLYYISHWNPLFDLRILFLTVWRMLFSKQKHAY